MTYLYETLISNQMKQFISKICSSPSTPFVWFIITTLLIYFIIDCKQVETKWCIINNFSTLSLSPSFRVNISYIIIHNHSPKICIKNSNFRIILSVKFIQIDSSVMINPYFKHNFCVVIFFFVRFTSNIKN